MRILIIEDEHKIAQALKKALQQENYAVDVSYDGDDGYAMATTEPYDLNIIDWMVPGKYDGLEIVKAMRKAKIHTPVLLLTAKGTVTDRTIGLNSGADDYLVKPFDLKELSARINAICKRVATKDVIDYKDIRLDKDQKKVFKKNKEIKFTIKEFLILELLLESI